MGGAQAFCSLSPGIEQLELSKGNSVLWQVSCSESAATVQSIFITENDNMPLLMVCLRQGSKKEKKSKRKLILNFSLTSSPHCHPHFP